MNSAPETEFADADDEATSFTVGTEDYSQGTKKTSSKRKSIGDDPSEIQYMIGDWLHASKSAMSEVTTRLFPANVNNATSGMDESSKRTQLFEAISAIGGFTEEHLSTSTRLLAHSKEDMDAFWGMPVATRGQFVMMLLEGFFKH